MIDSTVLVCITGDPLSVGHIRLLREAATRGRLVVGILSDLACQGNRQQPSAPFSERQEIIKGLECVSQTVEQSTWGYESVILEVKPDFFVHSTDWSFTDGQGVRERSIAACEQVGAVFVEVPFQESSGSRTGNHESLATSLPDGRRAALRSLLAAGKNLHFMEAHNPLSAIVVDHFRARSGATYRNLAIEGFDGIWSSSLTDSTSRGLPDTESLAISQRLQNVAEMFSVTSLPLIFDADTGGHPEHLATRLDTMERLGISAVVIEDKTGLKKNSLLGNSVPQSQDSIEAFSSKISHAVSTRLTTEFMVFARIESLILEAGMSDALNRAQAYVASGASGIMIHSRQSSPNEIVKFLSRFRALDATTPVITVPTSYSDIDTVRLFDAGCNIVIFANHLLRASYSSMMSISEAILSMGKTGPIEGEIASIPEILDLIPGTS